LDIERVMRVRPDLWPRLFSEKEMSWLGTLREPLRQQMATALFSAKESFYKCQHAIAKEWLDFKDVEVHMTSQEFRVTVLKHGYPSEVASRIGPGGILLGEDFVITTVSMFD
jgi:4'-phosphopantetheinyl transferase EntD